MQVHDEVPVDGIFEDVSPHHPVPATVLVDGMRYIPSVGDQDDLRPLRFIVRELQNMGTLAVGLGFITSKVTLHFK